MLTAGESAVKKTFSFPLIFIEKLSELPMIALSPRLVSSAVVYYRSVFLNTFNVDSPILQTVKRIYPVREIITEAVNSHYAIAKEYDKDILVRKKKAWAVFHY